MNSPSNPLGAVFSRELLKCLLDFAQRHDLWVICDGVYEAFTWCQPHVSMASLDADDRVFSLSKTCAMTGARIGYLVTPPGLAQTMRTMQKAMISCASEPGQIAAIAAITGTRCRCSRARLGCAR